MLSETTALLLTATMLAGILTGPAESVPETDPAPLTRQELTYEAQELSSELTLHIDGKYSPEKLTDSDYSTKLSLPAGTVIELQAEQEFSALYMIWDQPPEQWTANSDSFSAVYGERGFIHEFEELPAGTKSLQITLPGGGVLCDIYAYTDGRLPDSVQLWTDPVDKADILLFPTHGDDEHLFFGGILPYYAGELGLSVQVAYVKNHWDEPLRPHEQLNGLWAVGVTAYPMLNGVNYNYTPFNQKNVIAYQVEMIRRFRPQVVVSHAENGEYNHGAHKLNSFCVKKAVVQAADEQYDGGSLALYGVWDTPKLYLHLYGYNRISLDYNQPLERFGGRTAFEMAEEGFAQHLSQHRWNFFVYPQGHPFDSSYFGLYRSTVGEDVEKNDLMENLTPYKLQA